MNDVGPGRRRVESGRARHRKGLRVARIIMRDCPSVFAQNLTRVWVFLGDGVGLCARAGLHGVLK